MAQERTRKRQSNAAPAVGELATDAAITALAEPASDPSTIPVFRVVTRDVASSAFSSEANRSGGRWTSPGVAAVYASTAPAGAILEFLAHLDGEKPIDLALVSARLPSRHVVRARDLPRGWRETPHRDDVREYGNRWVESGRSLALAVPSVLCERSTNLLINPGHEDASQLIIENVEPFVLDPRLLRE